MTTMNHQRMTSIGSPLLVILLVLTTTVLGATPATGAMDDPPSEAITWSVTTDETTFAPVSRAVDIAALDDRAVVVGTSGDGPTAAAWTSTAEGAWMPAELRAPGRSEMTAVTAWQEGFVAVGNRLGGERRAFVWTSPTGEEWERSRFDGAWFSDIVAAPDGLVIVGTENRTSAGSTYRGATAWRSSDGKEWTAERISFGVDQIPQAIGVTQDGELLAAGYGLTVNGDYQSVAWESGEVDDWDSVTLTDETTAEPAFQVGDIHVAPFGFLVAMNVEPRADEGSDGRSLVLLLHNEWFGGPYTTVQEVLVEEPSEAGGFRALAHVGEHLLTVGPAEVYVTTDGEEWLAVELSAFDGYTVTAFADVPDGGLLAVGHPLEPAEAAPVVWEGKPAA